MFSQRKAQLSWNGPIRSVFFESESPGKPQAIIFTIQTFAMPGLRKTLPCPMNLHRHSPTSGKALRCPEAHIRTKKNGNRPDHTWYVKKKYIPHSIVQKTSKSLQKSMIIAVIAQHFSPPQNLAQTLKQRKHKEPAFKPLLCSPPCQRLPSTALWPLLVLSSAPPGSIHLASGLRASNSAQQPHFFKTSWKPCSTFCLANAPQRNLNHQCQAPGTWPSAAQASKIAWDDDFCERSRWLLCFWHDRWSSSKIHPSQTWLWCSTPIKSLPTFSPFQLFRDGWLLPCGQVTVSASALPHRPVSPQSKAPKKGAKTTRLQTHKTPLGSFNFLCLDNPLKHRLLQRHILVFAGLI